MGAKSHLKDRHDIAAGFSRIAEIGVHQGAISGIAASPDGNRIMVANYGNDSISCVDFRGQEPFVRTVVGINEPFAVALAGSRAFVSTVSPAYDAIVAVDVDTNLVVDVHPMSHSIRDLAVSPDGTRVYAARTTSAGVDVAIVDTATGREDAIAISRAPGTVAECVRVSPDGRRVYAATTAASGGSFAVVDTIRRRVLDVVEIGSPIRDVAISPDGGAAYVLSCGPDFGAVLDVVDTRRSAVASTHKIAEISGLVTRLATSRDGKRAYLVSDEAVTVLRTGSYEVIGTISVDRQPSCVMESPDGKHLYIADYVGTVAVFDSAAPDTSTAASADDEPTVAHAWHLPELLTLEPA